MSKLLHCGKIKSRPSTHGLGLCHTISIGRINNPDTWYPCSQCVSRKVQGWIVPPCCIGYSITLPINCTCSYNQISQGCCHLETSISDNIKLLCTTSFRLSTCCAHTRQKLVFITTSKENLDILCLDMILGGKCNMVSNRWRFQEDYPEITRVAVLCSWQICPGTVDEIELEHPGWIPADEGFPTRSKTKRSELKQMAYFQRGLKLTERKSQALRPTSCLPRHVIRLWLDQSKAQCTTHTGHHLLSPVHPFFVYIGLAEQATEKVSNNPQVSSPHGLIKRWAAPTRTTHLDLVASRKGWAQRGTHHLLPPTTGPSHPACTSTPTVYTTGCKHPQSLAVSRDEPGSWVESMEVRPSLNQTEFISGLLVSPAFGLSVWYPDTFSQVQASCWCRGVIIRYRRVFMTFEGKGTLENMWRAGLPGILPQNFHQIKHLAAASIWYLITFPVPLPERDLASLWHRRHEEVLMYRTCLDQQTPRGGAWTGYGHSEHLGSCSINICHTAWAAGTGTVQAHICTSWDAAQLLHPCLTASGYTAPHLCDGTTEGNGAQNNAFTLDGVFH